MPADRNILSGGVDLDEGDVGRLVLRLSRKELRNSYRLEVHERGESGPIVQATLNANELSILRKIIDLVLEQQP